MKQATRMILGWTLLTAALSAQSSLEVIAAYYGADRGFVDVTSIVRAQAQAEGLGITVGTSSLGGDPFPGQAKTLRLYYKLKGEFQQGEWRDNENIAIGRLNSSIRGGGRSRGERGPAMPLTILQATYGVGNRTVDVTALMQSRVQGNALDFDVSRGQLGDPAPGTAKQLAVIYSYNGLTREARARDGERLRLPQDNMGTPATAVLKIVSAQYGSATRNADVTGLMTSRMTGNTLTVVVNNANMGGDPHVAVVKTLTVSYEWNGQRFTATAKEGETMTLPVDPAVAASPAATQPAANGVPADGVCFYPAQNYQGTPVCAVWGQDQPRVNTAFGSVKILGSVRAVELFESANFQGRSVRLTSDLADLSRASSGFFGTPSTWAPNLGSFRMGQ
jgi:hypothetical protein